MIKIAICDDDPSMAAQIESCIAELSMQGVQCEVYASGDELVAHRQRGLPEQDYHIYFLDIEMPGLNGIETAASLRAADSRAIIIFVTSHRDYVYQVFEVQPFRFLTKPFTTPALTKILHDSIGSIQNARKLFFFKVEREQYQVPFDNILYFESRGRKVKLAGVSFEHEFYDTLHGVRDRLDANLFVQTHASYLVNMEAIICIDDTAVQLGNGASLPISRKFRKDVKQAHLAFMAWRCGD